MDIIEAFINGEVHKVEGKVLTDELDWKEHPKFKNVFLKDYVAGKDTEYTLSCHIVRIVSGYSIGNHIHEKEVEIHQVVKGEGVCIFGDKEIAYKPGVVAIVPKGLPHSINAKTDLYILANFAPALR
ncbi:MAG: cupin domain-containing protein [Alphaproteobacteria bacterium]